MRALSDLMALVVLNLLTLLCSIPIVTAGAAFTALHYCVMKVIEGEGHMASLYFKQFRDNLKGSIPVWLIFLAAVGFIYLDFQIFGGNNIKGFDPVLLPVYVLVILMAALFVWIFPLKARIENTVFASFKNAAIMAIGYLPRTLAMMVIYAVLVFIFTQEMRLLPIAFVLGLSLPSYLCAFIYRKPILEVIKRMTQSDDDESGIPDEKGVS